MWMEWYFFCTVYGKYDFHLFYKLQESLLGHNLTFISEVGY